MRDLWRTIGQGRLWYGEMKNRAKNGSSYWVATTIAPVLDANGKPKQYVSIRTDFTTQKQMQEELMLARDAAEASSRSKSQFVANMSHEIRTPLTTIIGFAEAVLQGDLSEAEKLDALETVIRNGKHLLRVINDILDFSKIEAGKMEIETLDVSLFELLSDVGNLIRHHASKKGVLFALNYAYPLPTTIRTDATRLKQILINLANNAVKFTEANGAVAINVSFDRAREKLILEVTDTGIGLSEEQRGKLFQAFSQADTSTTRKFGGTGLGLIISAELAKRLGGEITLASEIGKGSRFTVTVATGTVADSTLVCQRVESTHQPIAHEPPPDKMSGTILLVEDGPDNQRFISFVLRKAGLTVEIRENGAQGVEAALKSDFDIVLMDMQMPVMDGYTAARTLREKGYRRPIIALTANIMKTDIDSSIAAGCNDYIGKPFERHIFLKKIRHFLACADRPSLEIIANKYRATHRLLEEDPELAATVLQFLDALPATLTQIDEQLKDDSWDSVARTCHTLKCSAALFSFSDIAARAGELEARVKLQQHAEAFAIVEHLKAACGVVRLDQPAFVQAYGEVQE